MGRRRPDRITKNIPATRRICRSAAIKVSASQSLDKLLRVIFPQDTFFENQAPVSEDTVMEEVSKTQVTDDDDSSRGEASDEEEYDDSADMETNLNELPVF